MMRHIIASVIDIVDDPHAFATAYVLHVERSRMAGTEPQTVTLAALNYSSFGRI